MTATFLALIVFIDVSLHSRAMRVEEPPMDRLTNKKKGDTVM